MRINVLMFTKIMTSLLKSGLALQDALSIAKEILRSRYDKEFLEKVLAGVKNGNTLSNEIYEYENQFGNLYVSLIKIGEETGKLCEIFEKLEEYLQERKSRKEKLLQSLMYPLIVLVTAVLMIAVCVFFVFPKLEGIFEAFGNSGEILEVKINGLKFGLLIVFITLLSLMIFALFVWMLCKKSKKVKMIADKFLLKFPFLGKEMVFAYTKDFSFSMKILTSTFYSFNESLQFSASVVSNLFYRKAIINVYEKTMKGYDIADNFESEKIFPVYFTSWIRLSERNGNLNYAFDEIYEYFKTESENSSKRFGNAVEPVFILITGIIVIFIIAQFVIPVFKLMGTL